LVRFNHKKCDKSKIADLKQKEDAKAKKLKTHAERIQVVSSDMLRTSQLNGGFFPSPAPNVQEAHTHLQQDAPLHQSRMTQVEQPDVANAGGSFHSPACAQSQEEDAPWRQSTITQAHAPQLEQPAANSEAGKDLEPVVVLPPGWQACRGEDHKLVYFHKATGTFEASLDVMFQKKSPITPPAAAAHITPDAARNKKTPPCSPPPTHPDAAKSCSVIDVAASSPTRKKITITQVPGVTDLMNTLVTRNSGIGSLYLPGFCYVGGIG
jgi:hypothetical protein